MGVSKENLFPTGTLYWITGLSRAGKTSVGQAVYKRLRAEKDNVVFLDGDLLREAFGQQADFSRDTRLALAMRYGRLCKLLTDQGIDVICATICLFHHCQAWNRQHIPKYLEVLLTAPMEVLCDRDKKGLYRQAMQGKRRDVVGIDIQPEYPLAPELAFINDGTLSPDQLARDIITFPGLRL